MQQDVLAFKEPQVFNLSVVGGGIGKSGSISSTAGS